MLQRNALYEKGLAHLQTGQWHEALECLEPLARAYPDSKTIQHALDEARFRAKLDTTTRVRAKRWALPPWRGIAIRALIVLVIVTLAVQGTIVLRRYLTPIMAEAQEIRRQRQLLAEGDAHLEAGDLDVAEDSYRDLLTRVPGHEGAIQGLAQVAEQRRILNLYQQGVALQEEGDYEAALEMFTELSLLDSDYRDVNLRTQAIARQQELDRLFIEAEEDFRDGLALDALLKYEQIRELNVTYHGDLIARRLLELHLKLGHQLMEGNPPAAEAVPQALEHFRTALALQPRSVEVQLEYRLASLYLEGQTMYDEGLWDTALAPLRAVYDQRPGYLSGKVADLLYDAYIRSGDQHRDAGDPGLAYEQYRRAADLRVADASLARNRMVTTIPLLTPTATPTVTSTPTATPTGTLIPTITPIATWTPVPTRTPIPPTPTPKPLAAFRNQIVFTSTDEDNPGYWVMDSNGENRLYLGSSRSLRLQFEELLEQARLSPDGRLRVYTEQAQGAASAQIFMTQPRHPQFGDLPPRQITQLTGLSYHPVWSPDGGRIAFVSQEAGSDDIWLINTDGTGSRNLTSNVWEWDKHPFWAPDSRRIVFWSNRTGIKQIFVMDADGHNVRNISNTDWDEYDPIWIR